jgi:ferrochelatase
MTRALLLVNFGGPRIMREVRPFLRALLTDQDVLQTRFPAWLHRLVFSRIANRRACRICGEYRELGGGSPLFRDTEQIAAEMRDLFEGPVLTLHRYLPDTHSDLKEALVQLATKVDEVIVIPLFPQFSYTTTGSCARWLLHVMPKPLLNKFRWIKSYGTDSLFVTAWQERIRMKLSQLSWDEQQTVLLFSAHGIPQRYAEAGDPYAVECERSMQAILQAFPRAQGRLCYQSQFGPEQWLQPYTSLLVQTLGDEIPDRRQCLIVPHAFTTDHLETLVEIEDQYLSVLKQKGWQAHRVDCLQGSQTFVRALARLAEQRESCTTQMLIRH